MSCLSNCVYSMPFPNRSLQAFVLDTSVSQEFEYRSWTIFSTTFLSFLCYSITMWAPLIERLWACSWEVHVLSDTPNGYLTAHVNSEIFPNTAGYFQSLSFLNGCGIRFKGSEVAFCTQNHWSRLKVHFQWCIVSNSRPLISSLPIWALFAQQRNETMDCNVKRLIKIRSSYLSVCTAPVLLTLKESLFPLFS